MGKSETSSEEGDNPRPWQSYHTVYTNAKAGMDGVDKEKVQRIVYEMSKGSKYFENEEKKEAFVKQRIGNMRAQCAKLTAADLSHYQMVADKRILELEATRDLSRVWLHVDMDAFYAAVETLSNPSLKGKPMAVGSMSMISTANYEARRFGVRAAMPGFIARKLCPQLIFVPTDFKKYTYYSDLTRKVFQRYDPRFMAASLDEAYLDVTDVCKERGLASGEIAEELRTCVFEETGLTCSAGVAPNRLLAKVSSDIKKPNGQFVLPNDRMAIMTFISSLPIRKIGGIGKVTENVLRDVLEVNTCEEMLQKGGLICALFSHSTADFFLSVGLGLGRTDTPEVKFRKSISSERTFSATDDEALLYEKLADIAEMLCADMQKEGLCGRTLTLKLKTASFEIRSRAVTLQNFICSREDILRHASKLLKAELPISLRLIGLRMSHFNEDKTDAPPNRTQKTLNKFLMAEVSRKSLGEQNSFGSDVSAEKFMNDVEASFSTDSHEMHHYERDPLDSIDLQDPDDHSGIICDIKKVYEPPSNRTAEKMDAAELMGIEPPVEFRQTKVSWTEADSSTGQVERSRSDSAIIMHDQAVPLSEPKDQFFWVDDYKCSLCGIEMPPDLILERHEHSDYHLAERLQREESIINSKNLMMRQRCLQKDHISSQGRHKRMKPTPKEKKHLSIDMFFVKSSQNF